MRLSRDGLHRMEEILGIFFHQGFDYLIDETNLVHYLPLTLRFKARLKKKAHLPLPIRVRAAFEELGPSFVKLGQLLSLRPDLVPYSFLLEFEKMQDKGPQVPFSVIKEEVETALGSPLPKNFLQFSQSPLASASLAQVHRAQLKNKELVIVKVRRPGIKQQMETDVIVMEFLAEALQKYFPNPYNFPKIVEEFKAWTQKELDFRTESVNAKIFREHALESKLFYVPKVYDAFSSEDVLVLEYIDGTSLHDIGLLKKRGHNVHQILETGCRALIVQVFDKGFFHADPHPGNILVMKSGALAFIDFGIVGQFDDHLKRKSLEFVYGLTANNPDLAINALYSMSKNGAVKDRQEFDRKMKQLMYPLQYTSLHELKLTEALKNMFVVCAEHNVAIPPDFILFGKTIVTLEGIALRYDPSFSLTRNVASTIREIMKKEVSPAHFYRRLKSSAIQVLDFFDDFPQYAKDITDRLRTGKLTMDIETSDIRALTSELEHSSGNVSLGLIIAALLISATILFQYQEYQSLAVGGYSVATLLGLWLIKHTIYRFHER